MEPQMNPAIVGLAPVSSELEPVEIKEIRDICLDLLAHFKSPSYPMVELDPVLHDLCVQEVKLAGYDVEHPSMVFMFAKCLPGGIRMASTAYGHVEDMSRRIFVALYTGFVFYVEDAFTDDMTGLANFHVRFCSAEPHEDVVLDFFAKFFRGMHAYFEPMAANIILAAALNFVTAQFVEHRTKNLKLSSSAKRFPKFSRGLSGTAEPYAFLIFPREVPVDTYIHCLPELIVFVNEGNDVLSFYKEEIAGEDTNLVSTTAFCSGLKKSDVLRDFANDVIEADRNVISMLEPDAAALKAYNDFAERYIAFHTSYARYRLDELIAGERK
ncbi:terpenoid synthase [Hymenopellis radicata]|nr:terpenoid synthase [Hymenopellis radicata]